MIHFITSSAIPQLLCNCEGPLLYVGLGAPGVIKLTCSVSFPKFSYTPMKQTRSAARGTIESWSLQWYGILSSPLAVNKFLIHLFSFILFIDRFLGYLMMLFQLQTRYHSIAQPQAHVWSDQFRMQHNEALRDLYKSSSIVRIVVAMGWACSSNGCDKRAYRSFLGKEFAELPIGRTSRKWKDNFKIHLVRIGSGRKWCPVQWRALILAELNLRVLLS
jgi:hypothetical protein